MSVELRNMDYFKWAVPSLVACGVYLALSQFAQASPSEKTFPVYGKGAPTVPSSVIVPNITIGQEVIATATGSIDPDDDPITYEIRWCTQSGGKGVCVIGEKQNFTTFGNRYVAARAMTSRAFPQETQGSSPWSPEVLAKDINDSTADFQAGCSNGFVRMGQLVFSCPLTKNAADRFSLPYAYAIDSTTDNTSASTPSVGKTFIAHYQTLGADFCQKLVANGSADWRLPTKNELQSLYSTGFLKNNGWPFDRVGTGNNNILYHTSESRMQDQDRLSSVVNMVNGTIGEVVSNASVNMGIMTSCVANIPL